MSKLTAHEMARARHSSYVLLSRLFLEGVSAETAPYLDAIPNLPPLTDLDALAAEHQTTFNFNLFPFESIFLDASGLLGGSVSTALKAHYAQNGFATSEAPDHIGSELAYLAFLLGAEIDALEDRRDNIVSDIQHRQRVFLAQHLLRWLPPFAVGLSMQPSRLFSNLASLTWLLVASHAEALNGQAAYPLPSAPQDLDSDATSLRDIAQSLTTPRHSGWWLGQHALGQIGRKLNLPRGFTGRTQTLLNMLRTASEYDATSDLFSELIIHANKWQSTYASLDVQSNTVQPWQQRLASTTRSLSRMRTQLNENTP